MMSTEEVDAIDAWRGSAELMRALSMAQKLKG
jgi:hypothetical protein